MTLNTLSRLKGIETASAISSCMSEISLNTLSRLKGIETIVITSRSLMITSL